MAVLVVDVGGSHVKLMSSPTASVKFDSGPKMRPRNFVQRLEAAAAELSFDRLSIGFPAVVREGKICNEPTHLASGWIGFDFSRALHKPVRVINDASMQALGSQTSGRTLFLGLGTGLGSALVWDNNVLPLELGHLPYRDRRPLEHATGKRGLERMGVKAWREEVRYAILQLKTALIADLVVLGGGNVHNMGRLPRGVRKGDNRNAYLGGVRLWETDPRTGEPRWRIL